MKRLLARIRSDIRGNVLILAGTGAVALVGGAGLSVDTVQWYLWKRQLQQAVDSGAAAGAYSLARGNDYSSSATRELNRNADSTLSITIERLANPPATGDYTGDTGAVEVVATTVRSLPFSSVFLDVAPAVRARAVAAIVSGGEHCVIALAENGVGVNVAGSGNVQLGCGVAANSDGSQAIYLEGSSWLDADPLSSVGGIHYASSNVPAGTSVNPYGLPVVDPLASRNLEVPSSPSSCTANNYTVAPPQTVTISPGRYCNGLTLKGTVTMSPGVYIVDRGSFTVTSQAHVIGEGVTIVLTGNSPSDIAYATIDGGADLNIRAPTQSEDAYWENIFLFQDPRGSTRLSQFSGGSSTAFEGIAYLPKGNVRFTGSSGQHADCLLLVANRVTFTGTTSIDNNCPSDYDDLNLSSRIVRVVE